MHDRDVDGRIAVVSAVVVLLFLWAGACSDDGSRPSTAAGSSTTLPAPPAPAPVRWTPCPEVGERAECATLQVPLDYAHPSGETISLAVSRIPATSPDPHLGSLVVNPGGPGGPGLDLPAQLVEEAGSAPNDLAMLDRFDLIGFDPRGVGRSTPVDCGDTTGLDRADYSPDDAAEMAELKATMKSFADACAARSGSLLRFVGTVNAARDIDQIRRALGGDDISLFGRSYGTELFATYAHLYPEHVRAAVLDGAIPTLDSGMTEYAEQAQSLEVQMQKFLDKCSSRSDCAISSTGSSTGRADVVLDDLIARWDLHPPTVATGDTITASQATTVAAGALFTAGFQKLLESGIAQAVTGDASAVQQGWRIASGTADGGTSNSSEAIVAINCADHAWPAPDTMFDRAVTRQEAASPRMGEAFLREILPCAYWPFRGTELPPRTAEGSPILLVVGTTDDPATPYSWSVKLTSQLHDAVLLTRDGIGHTAWGHSQCIDSAVDSYLLSGQTPPDGTVCPSDP
jgi:pimeloyl-ACP methyl ester carboxylesterase